jgi:hypothetical protein
MLCSFHIWAAILRTWCSLRLKPTNKWTILWWSCFSTSAGKIAFHPSFSRDFSWLTQSRSILRGIPHSILDAAARGFPELRADAASLKYSGDHCALTPLHVFSWSQENTVRFSDQNSVRENEEYKGRAMDRSVNGRRQQIRQTVLC